MIQTCYNKTPEFFLPFSKKCFSQSHLSLNTLCGAVTGLTYIAYKLKSKGCCHHRYPGHKVWARRGLGR